MFRFNCPSCKQVLQAAEHQVGVLIACPKCKKQLKVPSAPAASPAQAPRPTAGAAPPKPPAAPPKPAAVSAAAVQTTKPPPVKKPSAAVQTTPKPPPPTKVPAATAVDEPTITFDGKLPWWKRILHETQACVRATWEQTVRLARFGTGSWRRRSLQGSLAQAHLALGERMYISGSGAPQVRQQIAAVEAKIREAQGAKQSTKVMTRERQALVLKLSEPALSQQKAPNAAEAEHKKVKDIQAALQTQEQGMGQARTALLPVQRGDRIRVAAGYASIACVLLLAVVVLGRGKSGSTDGTGSTGSTASSGGDGKTPVAKGPGPVLDLVPSDSMGFFHLRLADLIASEPLKGVKPQLEKDSPDVLKEFTDKTGLGIDDIESITGFASIIDPKATGEAPVVAILRTSAPYERDKILKNLGNNEEKSIKGKTYYVAKKSKKDAIHFIDEWTILASEEKWLEQYFENFDASKTDGPFSHVVKTAREKHHIVFALDPTMLAKELDKGLPPQAAPFKVLLEMKMATMILDLTSAEAKIDVDLVFPDEDKAKKAARALNDLMGIVRLGIGQIKPAIQQQGDADAIKVIDQVQAVVDNLDAKATNEIVKLPVRMKIDSSFADGLLKTIKKNKGMLK